MLEYPECHHRPWCQMWKGRGFCSTCPTEECLHPEDHNNSTQGWVEFEKEEDIDLRLKDQIYICRAERLSCLEFTFKKGFAFWREDSGVYASSGFRDLNHEYMIHVFYYDFEENIWKDSWPELGSHPFLDEVLDSIEEFKKQQDFEEAIEASKKEKPLFISDEVIKFEKEYDNGDSVDTKFYPTGYPGIYEVLQETFGENAREEKSLGFMPLSVRQYAEMKDYSDFVEVGGR